MAAETNPVQQRMEYLADLWNNLPIHKHKIICATIDMQDVEMMNAFYWYMLGIDAPFADIAILFESEFADIDTYSLALVRELERMVNVWNEMEMSPEIIKEPIDWKPDYSIFDKKNEARLFVENINRLTDKLPLDKHQYIVANLLMPHLKMESRIRDWMSNLLELELSSKIRILITNIKQDKTYNGLLLSSKGVYEWKPDIDTPNVMSQMAAMGNPLDPGTEYRYCFVKMINAIGKQDYKKTIELGETCIKIATGNVEKDPYWISQIVVIQITLSNEDYRNKKEKDALLRADKAIANGMLMPEIIGEELGCTVLAQAQFNKASLFCSGKKWKEAYPIFVDAAGNFTKSHIFISALEAYRMAGFCANKKGSSDEELENLYKGFQISENINDETLRMTTFPMLIYQLIKLNYKEYLSYNELDKKSKKVFGENWEEIINSLKKQPDVDSLYDDNPYIIEPANYLKS